MSLNLKLDMNAQRTIGILAETKSPPDSRVVLPPLLCKEAINRHPSLRIVVQSSPSRCFSDDEYRDLGIEVVDDVSFCDVLLGVKEVAIDQLVDDKTYFFFSHTIKAQPYNRRLLQTILAKNIELIDYECLRSKDGPRVIAFGRWAGIVGAYNGLRALSMRLSLGELPAMHKCFDLAEALDALRAIDFSSVRLAVTGTGRVSRGAEEIVKAAGFEEVSPSSYASSEHNGQYVMLPTESLFAHDEFGFHTSFYTDPSGYRSTLLPYLQSTNLLVNGIYWDNRAPSFFTKEEAHTLLKSNRLTTIADITCDIAPEASIPLTIRPSIIGDAVYGVEPQSLTELPPYSSNGLDIMAVDNLPNELPRDASMDFGAMFIEHVLDAMMTNDYSNHEMIKQATIAQAGKLTSAYQYLTEYVNA